MNRVLCFGELILSLTHSSYRSWATETAMSVCLGGSEMNVASALAKWNVPVTYLTAMPDNYLTKSILSHLSATGVDTDALLTGNRLGICYIQEGSDLKDPLAIYDRSNSSFSSLKPGMIDWDKVLNNVSWFHFSAIPPALNENVADVCREAVNAASRKNIPISIDLNYRSSLWAKSGNPLGVMDELAQHCTIIMGNIWSANALLGIPLDIEMHNKGTHKAYLEHAGETARTIMRKYPACEIVANTFRIETGRHSMDYFSAVDTGDIQYHSEYYASSSIKNKVGSGDCFMAGLIYGMHEKWDMDLTIAFATKAAFLKMRETGDTTKNSVERIKAAII